MSSSQWHDDQSIGERALRDAAKKRELDERLCDALRASGINADDAAAVELLYAVAGASGAHRIVMAARAIGAWLKAGGGT